MSYRPRRTRIYGANYDIGESYYKKQLNDLDRKRGVSIDRPATDLYSDFPAKDITPKVSFLDDADVDSFKFNKPKPFQLGKSLLDDFNDDSLKLSPYTPKPVENLDDDFDLEIQNIRKNIRKNRESMGRSRLNDLDMEDTGSSFTSRRKLRISTERFLTSDTNAAEEMATSRAKATKARLADLEMEMSSIADKQSERQKRSYDLKKLLNESESDGSIFK